MAEIKTLPTSLKTAQVFCYIHIVLSLVIIAFAFWALDTSSSSSGFLMGVKSALYDLTRNKLHYPVYNAEAAGGVVGMVLVPLAIAWAALWTIRSPTTKKSYIVLLLLIAVGVMGSVTLLVAGICFLFPKARQHLKIFQTILTR